MLNSEHKEYLKLQRTVLVNVPSVEDYYFKDLEIQYTSIRQFLPANATNVLDIGCGMGGIDYHISKHYNHNIDIHLLDKSGTSSEIYYGFDDEATYYSSLPLAKEFLTDNMSVPANRIKTHDMLTEPFPSDVRFDFVVSFISWGFHYPIREYLDKVLNTLNKNGVMIVDVRTETDGYRQLEKIGHIETINNFEKYKRLYVKVK